MEQKSVFLYMAHSSQRPIVKICGITRPKDASLAIELGADYLGMIVYPGSPRSVSEAQITELLPIIPEGKRVWVDVNPCAEKIKQIQEGAGGLFQIHFDSDLPIEAVRKWADVTEQKKLWLAPRIKPDHPFPQTLLSEVDNFLIDTFSKEAHGGIGLTGDWERFRNLQEHYPQKTWILAGGLNPENLKRALKYTGARFVDINSGVESEPGVKDAGKLHTLFEQIASLDIESQNRSETGLSFRHKTKTAIKGPK